MAQGASQMGGASVRTVRDISAGGVVVRQGPQGREVALVGRGKPVRWGLPKGGIEQGETIDRAAVREAQEETGLHVRLIAPVGDIQYWFATRGTRHHKTVHFFLMEAVGGDVKDHDWENDEAAWFPADTAAAMMAFPNEATIVRRALELWMRDGLAPDQPDGPPRVPDSSPGGRLKRHVSAPRHPIG